MTYNRTGLVVLIVIMLALGIAAVARSGDSMLQCPSEVTKSLRYIELARISHENWARYMQGGWASPLEVKMHGDVNFQLTWVRRYKHVERVLAKQCGVRRTTSVVEPTPIYLGGDVKPLPWYLYCPSAGSPVAW